ESSEPSVGMRMFLNIGSSPPGSRQATTHFHYLDLAAQLVATLPYCQGAERRYGAFWFRRRPPATCRYNLSACAARKPPFFSSESQMSHTLMCTGDVNLMNVTDPTVPFARVSETLRRADVLFGNLECCLYEPGGGQRSLSDEGFWAPPAAGKALKL